MYFITYTFSHIPNHLSTLFYNSTFKACMKKYMQKFNALGLSVDLMRQNMMQYGFISTAESVTVTNTSNEFTADWQNALFGYGLIFLTHYLIRFFREQSDRMFLAMLTYYLIGIMFKPTIGLILFLSPWWIRNYAALGEIVPDITGMD